MHALTESVSGSAGCGKPARPVGRGGGPQAITCSLPTLLVKNLESLFSCLELAVQIRADNLAE